MTELTGKRALVTGGSRGIGAAIARALAQKGADVAITYQSSAASAADVVSAITNRGRRGLAIQADSADPSAVRSSVDSAAAELGGLDILVNNAGIARSAPFAETAIDDLEDLLNVNVRAPVIASQAALRHMEAGGRIISIGSSLGERVPMPGVTLYSMTKSALLSFTRGLARELGPLDITVNLVQPGATDTDMNPADGEYSDALRAMTPLGRFGTPEDVAAAVVFLASPAARQITGTTLTVDGGINA